MANFTSVFSAQSAAKQAALERRARKFKPKLTDITIFTQQLSSMLGAGLPILSALDALQDQLEDPVFKVVVREVRNDVSAGTSFSDACRKFPNCFNTLFISMVEAGEASGALAEILGKVGGYFESTVKLTKKVKSALMYPIAVIALAVILVNVLLIFVIPVFAGMFADFGAKLPAPTQFLIDLSNWLQSNILFVLAAGVLAYWGLGKYVATPAGRKTKDRVLLRVPVFGKLMHKVALSRFCRTYATLVRSGVPILRTLEIVSNASGRTQIEDACAEITRHITAGGQVSEVLAQTPFFPSMMRHMVKAGEQTGNIDGMLNKVADFYDMETDAMISGLTSLIEPMLIVFLGVVVGGIVIAMFLPIFNIAGVVGGIQE